MYKQLICLIAHETKYKKNQNKANKYKIQQNTQLHLMLHEKKAKNSHGYSL